MKKNFLLSFFLLPILVMAQEKTELPPQVADIRHNIVLTTSNDGGRYAFQDNRTDVKASECRRVKTEDGREVFEIEVFADGKSTYDAELGIRSISEVKQGDIMLARVTLRTIYARQETGESAIHVYFQRSTAPYEKSLKTQLATDKAWKTFELPFVAKNDLATGEAMISLALGTLRQKVQIAHVEVLNFHRNCTYADLPITRFTYSGREADATWRKEALARIEQLRTAPLMVQVVDEKGHALKGAEVEVRMSKSAFVWGTSVCESMLGGEESESDTYKQHLKQLFNTATIENGLKAAGWYWTDERKVQTLRAFEWLQQNGMQVRGHTLIWPGWKFNTRSNHLVAEQDTAAFRRLILAQMQERMAYTKGKVIGWDVVNEMMHETDFFSYLPEGIAVEWFKEAKRLDPDAQLFINDYAMLNGTHSPLVIQEYIRLIKELRAKGAPIEAAGVQGHVGTQPRSPIQILSDLDLFYTERIPVQITEFDIDTDDEQLQADYTRDFLIAAYSHPAVEGIILWGFWQKRHWKPRAAMFRTDWNEKPNGKAWRELVCDKWATHLKQHTDHQGIIKGRAHLGEYEINVFHKGHTATVSCTLDKQGKTVKVILP